MKARRSLIYLAAALALSPAAAFCAAAALGQSRALNKLVTPNNDGKNDLFIFRCYNPRDSAIEAGIYDVSGREVATMTLRQRYTAATASASPTGEYYDLQWNPNSGGHHPGGVYLYQVQVETKVYKGTVVIIR